MDLEQAKRKRKEKKKKKVQGRKELGPGPWSPTPLSKSELNWPPCEKKRKKRKKGGKKETRKQRALESGHALEAKFPEITIQSPGKRGGKGGEGVAPYPQGRCSLMRKKKK